MKRTLSVIMVCTSIASLIAAKTTNEIDVRFINKTDHALTARFVIGNSHPTIEGYLIEANTTTEIELPKLYWFEPRGTGLGSNTIMNVLMGQVPTTAYIMSQDPAVGGEYVLKLSEERKQSFEINLEKQHLIIKKSVR